MIEEAELAVRNVRSLANSVLTILLHGIAALQSDRHTAASLRAAAVLKPTAHGLTGQVATALQVIVLTDRVVTVPVVTARTPVKLIARLALNPDPPIGRVVTAQLEIDLIDPLVTDPTDQVVIVPVATGLTVLAVTARIHQEPIVRLAQKPNPLIVQVVTAQVAIDLTDPVETAPEVTGLTVLAVNDPLVTARIHQEPIIRLALNPDPPIVLAVTVPVVIDLIDPPVTDHIHQEPIVRLAQKPSVLIGQVGTDLLATGLT